MRPLADVLFRMLGYVPKPPQEAVELAVRTRGAWILNARDPVVSEGLYTLEKLLRSMRL